MGLVPALRDAAERRSPIPMAALVTEIGLLPLCLGWGHAGDEIKGSIAIVIPRELFTSTTINLAVLPTPALHFGRFEAQVAER